MLAFILPTPLTRHPGRLQILYSPRESKCTHLPAACALATPKEKQQVIPQATLHATPQPTPQPTPRVTPQANPRASPQSNPQGNIPGTTKETSEPTPQLTLQENPGLTSEETAQSLASPSSLFNSVANQSCGFAALLGPSNSGKSTLLNHLVGQKVAIVTPKVQTTRCRVSGIASFGTTQVIWLDTPGIFDASNRLSRAMVKSAWVSGAQADAVAIIVDAAAMYYDARREGIRKLHVPESVIEVMKGVARRRSRGHNADVCVCANKIDAVPEKDRAFVEEQMRLIMDKFGLADIETSLFSISARYGDGVDLFRAWVVDRMPAGPWLYPDDGLTDMPARLLAAEVSREKAFMVLKQELPYEIAIETTSYKEKDDGSIRITQDILVSRDSQKRIVTGHHGAVVKSIGTKSRMDLQEILGTTVHLMLTVKVRNKWKEDKSQYDQWGLDFNA